MKPISLLKNTLLGFFILASFMLKAQDQCQPVGWATQNGGVTGGGNASATTVSTYAQLKAACQSATVKVVYVQGDITLPLNGRIGIQDQADKTIIGLPGSSITSIDLTSGGSGIFYIKRCDNFIIRNLVLIGPGAFDEDGNDNLTVDDCRNFWVDHCEFHDGMDGNFDLKNMADYISVTWCKFSYEKPPIPGGSGGANDHRFSNLIGSGDNATQDDGKLRITFQYCWWAQGCADRMPRVRFGKVHVANNYFSSTDANNCVKGGFKADLLVEGNVFERVNEPIDFMDNTFTAITVRNNIFTNTTGNTAGSRTSFTPPYILTLAPTTTVKSLVTNASCGAGATLDSPTQCGCGTTPGNIKPTVSLTAPSNASSYCPGTSITISANAADSDGSVSGVSFYRGAALIGTDNSAPYSISWTYSIAGTYTLTAVATDNLGATTTSAGISVTINSRTIPNIAISSSATSVCAGTGITMTATSTNGGTNPTVVWFKNNVQVSTGTTYNYVPINGDAVSARLTAGGTLPACLSPTTDVSNLINLTVTPVSVPNIVISSSATSVCAGTAITMTATSTNGGTNPTIAWFKNNTQVSTGTTYNYVPINGDAVSARLTAGGTLPACLAPTTDVSNLINLNVTPVSVPNIAISSSATSVCSGTGITFTATSTNGGTNPTFSWFKNNTQVSTGTTYNYVPSNGDAISARMTAGGTLPACLAPTTDVSNLINLTVTPVSVPNIAISSSATSVCSGTGITFTATSTNGGTNPTIAWFRNNTQVSTGTTFNYVPANGDAISARLTAGGTLPACLAPTTDVSNLINLTVTPVSKPNIAISSSGTSVCSGTGITFAATSTNGGTNPTIAWFKNNTQVSTGTTYNYVPENGDAISARLTAGGTLPACLAPTTDVSNLINLNVTPVSVPNIAISSSATSVCSGTGITFTATSTNGGTNPTIAWFRNNTQVSTGTTYNYIPSNGDAISARLTAGGTLPACLAPTTDVSNLINLTVTRVSVTNIAISSSANSVCSGTGITLTATSTNGGTNPTIAWFKNNTQVSTGTTYNYVPTNGDAISARLTAGGTLPACLAPTTDVSNLINIAVNPLLTPSLTIANNVNSVCSGTGMSFTATGLNLGNTPSYSWTVNSVVRGTGSIFSYIPANGDLVRATLSTSGNCFSTTSAQSNVLQPVVFSPLTVSVSVSPSANPVCSGTGVVYTANVINVGTAPVYTWRVNGLVRTGSTSVFNFTPSNGDIITASVTAGGTFPSCLINTSATSTGANATVNGTINTSISIATANNTLCQGSPVTFTATAGGTGSSPVYEWFVNSVKQSSTATNFTYVPSQSDVVRATMTPGGNGTSCILGGLASSAGVTLNVQGLQIPSLSIVSSANSYCAGSLATFTANAINGGTTPVFTWYVNGSLQASGKTFNYSPSNADQVIAKLNVGGTLPTCLTASTATSSSIAVSVNSLNSPSVAISASSTSLCSGTGVTFTALGINAGSLPSIEWFKNNVSVATGTTYSYLPANGDLILAKLTVGGTLPVCLSSSTALSNIVGLTVAVCLKPQVSSISGPSFVLDGAQDVVYSVPNVPGDAYQWNLPSGATIVNGQGTNSITVNFGTGVSGPISLTQTNANGSTQVQLDVNSGVPPTQPTISGSPAVLNGSTSVAYSIPSVAGVNYQWTVPAGVTIVSGQGTNNLVVDFGNNVLGDIGVSVSNSFGTTSASMEVSSGGVPSLGSISGLAAVIANQSGVVYTISSVAGTNYQWSVPSGATIVSGQGTNSIIVDFGGNVAGNIGVIATNAFGNASTSIAITETIATDFSPSSIAGGIMVYPNPSQQGFTVESSTAEVKVLNIHGETMDQFTHQIKSSFGENYAAGVYFIQLSNGTGQINMIRLVKLQ